MKLSDKKFEDLHIGDRVISALGNPGKITALIPEGQPSKHSFSERYDSISMKWDHLENESHGFHMSCDCIQLID